MKNRSLKCLVAACCLTLAASAVCLGQDRSSNKLKDAALSARRQEPFKSWYQERIAKGQRPEMVRWSLARKLAATTLIIWQRGEKFDGQKVSATLRGE